MKKLNFVVAQILLAMLLVLLVSACSKDKGFAVEGHVSDGATMNIRALYYDNGKLQNSVFPTDKGAFVMRGTSADGTIVELLSNDYRLLGRFYAVDGDQLKVTLDPKSPNKIRVEGNETAQRWAKILNDNAKLLDSKNAVHINAFVAKYVGAHRGDIVSTLLLLTTYDWSINPAEGEKLLSTIKTEARPAHLVDGYSLNLARVGKQAGEARVVPFSYLDERDSLATFNPRRQAMALLSFTDESSGRSDSIIPALRRIHDSIPDVKTLRVLDFSMDGDTLTWRRAVCADSTKFDHGWAAGSVAAIAISRLGIPRLPFFVVVDSTGTQIYRGSSISQAEAALATKETAKKEKPSAKK